MNTLRCPLCKKMYQFNGLPPKFCPECYEIDEEHYQRVRSLVKECPGINIVDVSDKTGVSRTRIMRYLREERLEAVSSDTVFLTCLSCGKAINTGNYCSDCRRRNSTNADVSPEEVAELEKNRYNVENISSERAKR